ncbi:Lrp/AsnC family transcriptional regulator [Plastorhodobacter daqingensis]|uniref:Lrp/AsnC family transcriptional regulator n=1 Tax=Plastorhodobacter daqingensis TaxID=1387281 RepID=A0ABW2UGH0_9RHOB
MDETDLRLIAALRRNGRAGISELAADLGLGRATIRARMERLAATGDILGYSVVTRSDAAEAPVRGLMMIGIEGRGTERIMARLMGMPAVRAVHSTNGKWDLIAEIGAQSLAELDAVLFQIRRLDGVATSETNLLLTTRRGG